MATFIEKNDGALAAQMHNFVTKLPNYQTVLGLTAAQVTAAQTDSAAFNYVCGNVLSVQTYGKNYTAFKNNLREGTTDTLGLFPIPPVFTTPPTMPFPGVESRFRALVQIISHSPGYTKAIGEDLGIEAPESAFNSKDGKPILKISLVDGGHPSLGWRIGKFQGVQIWKDDGSGYKKLETVMHHEFIDKSPLPPAGTSAVWKYKLIYVINNEVKGDYSEESSITVTGKV